MRHIEEKEINYPFLIDDIQSLASRLDPDSNKEDLVDILDEIAEIAQEASEEIDKNYIEPARLQFELEHAAGVI